MRPPDQLDPNLEHLVAELARIDLLLRREVQRWQQAGQDPADAFRGLYVSDAQAGALLDRPLGANWGTGATLDPADLAVYAGGQERAEHQAGTLAQVARDQGQAVRLQRLAAAFDLDQFEVDTLLICLAPALDLRYERVYGYLQDDITKKCPGVSLVLDLLCEPGLGRLARLASFRDEAPLLRHHLLEWAAEPGGDRLPLLNRTLALDGALVAWLLGSYQPHAVLGQHATLSQPQESEPNALIRCDTLRKCVAPGTTPPTQPQDPPIIAFYGPDQVSQAAGAGWLAAQAGRPLLTVDLAAVIDEGTASLRALRLALRDARLTGALPFLTGWDASLDDGAPSPELLAELGDYPNLAIVASQAPWQPRGIERHRQFLWLEFPIPAYAQRLALWEHYLEFQTSEPEIAALASQFQLTAGQIRDAVATARDTAAQRGEPLQGGHLFAAARAHSNPRLSSLARKIVPRYSWDDIVLPGDQQTLLRELVATVRGRALVLDEWGVGRKLVSSRGVTALFAGPPGTGKTMAAEVIAGELGLDLYKLDLSTVVSKYIGETEKNLERIFDEAERSNAILFFDEADALFGKRSEVRDSHDRYANLEISYLLQRMEMYDGVTVLATNLRANLDEAFTRRLQFAVDFPFPEQEDRLYIWRTLFPPDVPRAADLDFALLAERFKLAGGNIRNILVGAAYLAAADGGTVTMEHLLHGTSRELKKMGRLVAEEDLQVTSEGSRSQKGVAKWP